MKPTAMFQSATFKLTAWYLLIIMVISLLFSGLVYRLSANELSNRFDNFGQHMFGPQPPVATTIWEEYRMEQSEEAARSILINLFYINCLILIAGGIASYLMAKRTLRPLEEAHETESRFVSDASHELRTPLTAMKMELEVALRDAKLSKSDMRELLHSNLEEVDKLTKLSQTLLALSKMDYESLTYAKVDLKRLTESVANRYTKESRQIIVKSPRFPLYANAHESSLEELITILVDNALKYSPSDSIVTIKLGRRVNRVSFDISNFGKGIREKDLPHIFDRFYRADHARTSNNTKSFGLGLSLAKQIVKLHDGELSVSSGENKVTTFSVLLPIFRSSKAKAAPTSSGHTQE